MDRTPEDPPVAIANCPVHGINFVMPLELVILEHTPMRALLACPVGPHPVVKTTDDISPEQFAILMGALAAVEVEKFLRDRDTITDLGGTPDI
jgi:hypothetical protein